VVIAYEPVWAIGTGLTPTDADIAEVHRLIREKLGALLGTGVAEGMRILYGGSVGGAVEFGESAEEAVAREFLEEIETPIRCTKQLCVLENLYDHHGTRGHEVVFAFEAELLGSAVESKASFSFVDGGVTNDVAWRPVREFSEGSQRLFPEKLVEYLP
jgi:ADP-ribose pyrophosphatase YjhB (NUDIX family)